MNGRGDAQLGGALAGVLALAVSLVVGLVFAPYRETVGLENVAILYVVVVALAAVGGGPTGGLVAAIAAALSYSFFFTTPYGSLRVDSAGQVITVVLLFAAGAVASLAGALQRRVARRRLVRALRHEGQAVEVVADALAARRRGEAPAPVAVEAIRRLLQARAVAQVDPQDPSGPALAVAGEGLPADLGALPQLDVRGLEALAEAAPFGSDPVLPRAGVVLSVPAGPGATAAFAVLPHADRALPRSARTALLTLAAELQRPGVQA